MAGDSVVEQEPHRHQLEIVLLDRDDLVFFRRRRALTRAEHERNARAIDVAIAQADARAGLLECDGEIRGHGRFADAAFAAGDRDHVLDSFNPRRADSGRASSGGRRMNIDQYLRLVTPGRSRSAASASVLIVARNGRLVRRQRELHRDIAILDRDAFDQTERNDVATKAGIFDGFERFLDLFFCNRHGVGGELTSHEDSRQPASDLTRSVFAAGEQNAREDGSDCDEECGDCKHAPSIATGIPGAFRLGKRAEKTYFRVSVSDTLVTFCDSG